MEILGIWVGYGLAVIGVSFGTKNGGAAVVVGVFGALMAMVATVTITGH